MKPSEAYPDDAPKTRDAILELLSRGQWYTTEEVCGYLAIACRRPMSESACSARIRELKLPQYGGHNKQSRPRKGCRAWEYIVLVEKAKAA